MNAFVREHLAIAQPNLKPRGNRIRGILNSEKVAK